MNQTLKVPHRPYRLAPPRPVMLQVRISEAEHERIRQQARAAGFDSVAAFVRARTLDAQSMP